MYLFVDTQLFYGISRYYTCMAVCMIDHGGKWKCYHAKYRVHCTDEKAIVLDVDSTNQTYIALKHTSTINQLKLYARRYLNILCLYQRCKSRILY